MEISDLKELRNIISENDDDNGENEDGYMEEDGGSLQQQENYKYFDPYDEEENVVDNMEETQEDSFMPFADETPQSDEGKESDGGEFNPYADMETPDETQNDDDYFNQRFEEVKKGGEGLRRKSKLNGDPKPETLQKDTEQDNVLTFVDQSFLNTGFNDPDAESNDVRFSQ